MKKFFSHRKNSNSEDHNKTRRKSGDGEIKGKHWWHHPGEAIDNPMLFESLLATGSEALSLADEDSINDLLVEFSESLTEDVSLVEQLLKLVAPEDQSLNDEGLTLLHIAAKKGFNQCLDILIKQSNNSWVSVPNITCKRYGHTPLHLAAKYGFDRCVHTLLNAKADPAILNFAKKTALHYACSFGYVACADAILNHTMGRWRLSTSSISASNKRERALIDMQDEFGLTALHLATVDGNSAIVRMLLQSHADTTLVDDGNRTALTIARTFDSSPEHLDIVRQLEYELTSSPHHLPHSHEHSVASAIPKASSLKSSNTSPPLLFEGMHLRVDSSVQLGTELSDTSAGDDPLFAGLQVHNDVPLSVTTTTTFRAKSPRMIAAPRPVSHSPAQTIVPAGRWVVLQSGMLVAEPSSGSILVHDSR